MEKMMLLIGKGNQDAVLSHLNQEPGKIGNLISVYEFMLKTNQHQHTTFIEHIISNSGDLILKYPLAGLAMILERLKGTQLHRVFLSKINEYNDKIIGSIDDEKVAALQTLYSQKTIPDPIIGLINQYRCEKIALIMFCEVSETYKTEYSYTPRVKFALNELSKAIDKLLKTEQVKSKDIVFIGNGAHTHVYRIGKKVLKVGFDRTHWEILDNPYCLAPDLRKRIPIGETTDEYLYIEVANYVADIPKDMPIEEVKEKLYEIYKGFRKCKCVPDDIRPENFGVLPSENAPSLIREGVEGIIPNPDYTEPIILGPGAWVLRDLDLVLSEKDGLNLLELAINMIKFYRKMRRLGIEVAGLDEYENDSNQRMPLELGIEFAKRYAEEATMGARSSTL